MSDNLIKFNNTCISQKLSCQNVSYICVDNQHVSNTDGFEISSEQ